MLWAIRFRVFSYRHVAIVPRFPVDLTVGEELHIRSDAL